MPPVHRKARALRGILDPELEGALIIGPSPRARFRDPLIRETLCEAYAEHREQVDELDAANRVPALRAWAFWEFTPAVPPELREDSSLEYHERTVARAVWLAATDRLYRWELPKLRSLAADREAETEGWHPWRDLLTAVTTARPELSRPTDPRPKATRGSRRSPARESATIEAQTGDAP